MEHCAALCSDLPCPSSLSPHPIHLLGTNIFFISVLSFFLQITTPLIIDTSPQKLVQLVNLRRLIPNHTFRRPNRAPLALSFLFNHFPCHLKPRKTHLAVCSCDKAFQPSGVVVPSSVSVSVRVLVLSEVELYLSDSVNERLFVWVEGPFGSVGTMDGRHVRHMARVRRKVVYYSASLRLRFGGKRLEMACSRPGPRVWSRGVGHRLPVFAQSLQ